MSSNAIAPLMEPLPADAERSIRRSRVRRRVLLMLSSMSEAYPRQLARACGIDTQRLRWIMEGHLPRYRPELGLVHLGLAIERWTENGRVYRITSRGRRKSRSLTSGLTKRGKPAAGLDER